MERLDEKIGRELKAHKRRAKLEAVKDFFIDTAEDISDACTSGINAVRSYFNKREQERTEQNLMKRKFESFVAKHDPNKIGTVEYEDLDNNGGMRVTVYTENGPLVKTFFSDELTLGQFAKTGADRYNWYSLCELAGDTHVSYEGYCADSASSDKYNHLYYVNLMQHRYTDYDSEIPMNAKHFTGFVRSDKGKFSKVDTSLPICYYDILPYLDLKRTFEEAYEQAIAGAELQA